MKRQILTLLLGLSLLIGIVPSVSSMVVNNSTNVTDGIHELITVGDLNIYVPTAEVPFYYFWDSDDNTTMYKLHLDNVFEINDVNENGAYDQFIDTIVGQSLTPLAQMDWELSEIISDAGENGPVTSFNLTGYVDGPNPNVNDDLVVQFQNHIYQTDDSVELKFDVLIQNYIWKSDDSLLTLGYKLEFTDHNWGNGPMKYQTQLATRAQFGLGYMESVPHAWNGTYGDFEHQINATMSIGNSDPFNGSDENPRIFITYSHFDGDLFHDPTIGIDQASEHTFVADELSLKVPTNQVPFFFFWNTENADDTYRLQFDTLFEVFDSNGDGIFNPDEEHLIPNSVFPLALLDWEMSDIVNDTANSMVHFNLTGIPGASPTVGDVQIQFNNHISVAGNDTELKFDIIVNNYEWTNTSEDTLMVLGYKLTTTNDQYSGLPTGNTSRAEFGNAYMNTVEYALANNGSDYQIETHMSVGSGSKIDATDNDARIYLSYSHFDGNMTHDPSLGLSSVADSTDTTTSDTTDTNGTENSSSDEAIFAPFMVLFAAFITGAVLMRRVKTDHIQ